MELPSLHWQPSTCCLWAGYISRIYPESNQKVDQIREQILKPRPSSRQPCPTEYSCQFSQLYEAGNTVTVLAKLAAHALRAIARDAHTGSQNQDPPAVSHAQLTIHAKFHSCIKQETW